MASRIMVLVRHVVSQVSMLPPWACMTTLAPRSRPASDSSPALPTVTAGARAEWMCTTSWPLAIRKTLQASFSVREMLPAVTSPPSGVSKWATLRKVISWSSPSSPVRRVFRNVGIPPRSG